MHSSPAPVPSGHNPWAIRRVRDLFAIFTMTVWLFLGLQAAAAYLAGIVAIDKNCPQRWIVAACFMGMFLVVDFAVFAVLRGRIYRAFIKPYLWVGLLTTAPCGLIGFVHYLFHLRGGS